MSVASFQFNVLLAFPTRSSNLRRQASTHCARPGRSRDERFLIGRCSQEALNGPPIRIATMWGGNERELVCKLYDISTNGERGLSIDHEVQCADVVPHIDQGKVLPFYLSIAGPDGLPQV